MLRIIYTNNNKPIGVRWTTTTTTLLLLILVGVGIQGIHSEVVSWSLKSSQLSDQQVTTSNSNVHHRSDKVRERERERLRECPRNTFESQSNLSYLFGLFGLFGLFMIIIVLNGDEKDCTELAPDKETLIVFSTLGGGLTAIDPITRLIRWTIADGI